MVLSHDGLHCIFLKNRTTLTLWVMLKVLTLVHTDKLMIYAKMVRAVIFLTIFSCKKQFYRRLCLSVHQALLENREFQ